MKKIFSLILLIFALYTLAVFQFPEQADSLGSKIGLSGYNEFMRSFKSTVEQTSTDIPTIDEAKDAYNGTFSGANSLKDTFLGGINTTKDKIDSVRETASGVQDTYNKTVETINTVKETVDGVTKTLNDLDTMREGIVNSVNTTQVETSIEASNQ